MHVVRVRIKYSDGVSDIDRRARLRLEKEVTALQRQNIETTAKLERLRLELARTVEALRERERECVRLRSENEALRLCGHRWGMS